MSKLSIAVASVLFAGNAWAEWGPYRVGYIRNFDGDSITFEFLLYPKPKLTLIDNVGVADIDTPEIGGCEPELAIAAKQFTRAFLSSGEIRLLIVGKDKYGRPLAHIAVRDRDLGTSLIAEGLARSYEQGWC